MLSSGSDDDCVHEVTRSRLTVALLAILGALTVAVLIALGTWQVHRLAWKQALIARVDRNSHAQPVEAPRRAEWATIGPEDEYRRVITTGVFLNDLETPVQALTVLGGGFWIITPLRRADGSIALVNRGFVPSERRERQTREPSQRSGLVTIGGLLRLSEPGGAFLRRNDPASARWYSRDVAAIASADHLGEVAPYFIDADAAPSPGGVPVGGLTVIAFPNNHLVYALTWYSLAAMLAGVLLWAGSSRLRQAGVVRQPRKQTAHERIGSELD